MQVELLSKFLADQFYSTNLRTNLIHLNSKSQIEESRTTVPISDYHDHRSHMHTNLD
ncbi:hypothetical protein HanPSC8_Chr11g0452441 [Helianthus annuus]|nr:hypothetical protein HanPSC8_Chr11g0452441 [Helianthus annuus]